MYLEIRKLTKPQIHHYIKTDRYTQLSREFNSTTPLGEYLPVQLTQHDDTDPIIFDHTLTDCGMEGVYYSCCTR